MNGDSKRDWVQMRRAEQLGVQVLTANFWSARSAPPHVHHDYVFSLAISGALEVDCGRCGETHVFKSGDLMLTEANQVYAGRALGAAPWRMRSISVSQGKLAALLEFAADGKQIALPHFAAGAVRDGRLRRLFLRLYDSIADAESLLAQDSALLDWTTFVQQTYAEQSEFRDDQRPFKEIAAVRRARDFISENFDKNIRLQDLAGIARLSPFHFNRAFAEQIGMPPHKFQNQLRIEKARDLIAERKPFAEIAAAVGFADQSHFNRFFKRYTGVTPKRFFVR